MSPLKIFLTALKAADLVVQNLSDSDFVLDHGSKTIEGLRAVRADIAFDIARSFGYPQPSDKYKDGDRPFGVDLAIRYHDKVFDDYEGLFVLLQDDMVIHDPTISECGRFDSNHFYGLTPQDAADIAAFNALKAEELSR